MGEGESTPGADLVRWTFTIDPARRAEVEGHLADLGLDVQVRDGGLFVVTWDEPDRDPDEVVEELWAIHGGPFEVTHEEFRRLDTFVYHDEGHEPGKAVA